MTHGRHVGVTCEYNVYCDESRHTSDPADSFLVIGALSCPREAKAELVARIRECQKEFSAFSEFGWKRLSPNRREFYWALLKLFVEDDRLRLRCLVADRKSLDHETFNAGDAELGFYKLYYQTLVHWLERGCTYHIYLDLQSNKEQGRFITLRDILRRKLTGVARIACLEPEVSKQQPLTQLVDLLIGAVGYAWNERHGSAIKAEFCQTLAHSLQLQTLHTSTSLESRKFNVFQFQGRNGG